MELSGAVIVYAKRIKGIWYTLQNIELTFVTFHKRNANVDLELFLADTWQDSAFEGCAFQSRRKTCKGDKLVVHVPDQGRAITMNGADIYQGPESISTILFSHSVWERG